MCAVQFHVKKHLVGILDRISFYYVGQCPGQGHRNANTASSRNTHARFHVSRGPFGWTVLEQSF